MEKDEVLRCYDFDVVQRLIEPPLNMLVQWSAWARLDEQAAETK